MLNAGFSLSARILSDFVGFCQIDFPSAGQETNWLQFSKKYFQILSLEWNQTSFNLKFDFYPQESFLETN